LTYLYRQIDACKITSQDGTRRAYVLRQIADVLTVADIEPRLEQLEKRNGSNVLLPVAARINWRPWRVSPRGLRSWNSRLCRHRSAITFSL
jgi:hypothetical protein